MYKKINTRGFAIVGVAFLITIFTLVSCSQVREAAFRGATSAVSEKVEQEVYRGVSSMLAGYSSAMLYQLAYTQAFLVGGYGIGMEDFEEGQGSTWRIEAGDNENRTSFTTERAFLKKESDEDIEMRWWVTEEVPGHLVRYEMRDKKDGGRAFGEMTDLRDGYTPKFASF
jgi:hypothetical protein